MKTACIYHSIDLDGWMSAAIVKHWFIKNGTYIRDNSKSLSNTISIEAANTIFEEIPNGDSLTFIGYNYGQPIPDLSEYDKVIMCDISFPAQEMKKIINKTIWVDHHISAILDWQNIELADLENKLPKLEGLRNTKFAACELTWKYFMEGIKGDPDKESIENPIPEIVRLLGRYDCFGHKGTDEETKVLEFQYGARQCISNYEEAYNYLSRQVSDYKNDDMFFIQESGEAIYKYLCTEAKHVYSNGFEIEFIIVNNKSCLNDIATVNHHKFICINKERFNPINFGIDYHKDGYDGCACFHYANGMWNFSIYNDNGLVDCSTIAKHYKGGGHRGAAGFKLNNEQFLQLIK